MKIGFDVSQTGSGKAGCGYYAEGLIRALAAGGGGYEYILYPAFGDGFWDPSGATTVYRNNAPTFRAIETPASQEFWQEPDADFEAKLGNPDLVHSHNFFCPRKLERARLVYTLHDLSFLVDPSWGTEANRVSCLDGAFRAATSADWIVANSDYTRRHFLEIFPHYPEERTQFVYPGSRFAAEGVASRPMPPQPGRFADLKPEGFWLTVGSIEPRKNHRRLVEAWHVAGAGMPLVMAGGKGWLMDDFTAGAGVVLTGYVSDSELEWLYRNCFALVYPSLFEGFGMPVLEGLSLGAPVICSNTTSLPEVTGDAGLLVDPLDAEAIAAAMSRLARGEASRETLRTAGYARARQFSWESSARKLLSVYAECGKREKWKEAAQL